MWMALSKIAVCFMTANGRGIDATIPQSGEQVNQQLGARLVLPAMRKEGLAYWKRVWGYHRRSLVETAMYRFKQLMTGKLSLRKYNGQVSEVMAYVHAMNKLNTLGLPVRKRRV